MFESLGTWSLTALVLIVCSVQSIVLMLRLGYLHLPATCSVASLDFVSFTFFSYKNPNSRRCELFYSNPLQFFSSLFLDFDKDSTAGGHRVSLDNSSQWLPGRVSLRGLPLAPCGEGYCYSILLVDSKAESRSLVEAFCLQKNATITLADCGSKALELLQSSHFNIVIVDVDVMNPEDFDRFRALTGTHSLLFVGIVAPGVYSDDYTLFDMQALRPLNESTINIIFQVEEITSQKLQMQCSGYNLSVDDAAVTTSSDHTSTPLPKTGHDRNGSAALVGADGRGWRSTSSAQTGLSIPIEANEEEVYRYSPPLSPPWGRRSCSRSEGAPAPPKNLRCTEGNNINGTSAPKFLTREQNGMFGGIFKRFIVCGNNDDGY